MWQKFKTAKLYKNKQCDDSECILRFRDVESINFGSSFRFGKLPRQINLKNVRCMRCSVQRFAYYILATENLKFHVDMQKEA